MNTKIQFEKDGKKYILEYDRKSISSMERLGFNVNEFGDKPMTMLPLAFKGLFIKNGRGQPRPFYHLFYAEILMPSIFLF